MNDALPPHLGKLAQQHGGPWNTYQALGKACAESGPLDERTRRLAAASWWAPAEPWRISMEKGKPS